MTLSTKVAEQPNRFTQVVHDYFFYFLAFAIAGLYAPLLSAGFIELDDKLYVLSNPYVVHPDFLKIFNLSTLTVSDWTPLVTLNYALEYKLAGFEPFVFHSTNILLHLFTCFLLFSFLKSFSLPVHSCALASLLYAIHPLQVEPVGWISDRKDLLATFFGLAFLYLFNRKYLLGALLCLVSALMSKGTAVSFSIAAVALFYSQDHLKHSKKAYFVAASVMLLGIARATISFFAQYDVVHNEANLSVTFFDRMKIMGPVMARQFRQFFFPNDLSFIYMWAPETVSLPYSLAAWTLLGLTLVQVVRYLRNDSVGLFMLAFLLSALLPVMNILPTPFFQTDRYVHTALIPMAVLCVHYLPQALHLSLRIWHCLLLVGFCFFLPISHQLQQHWQSDQTVWSDLVQKNPSYAFGWSMLARSYVTTKQFGKAEDAYQKTLLITPQNSAVAFDYALLLGRLNKKEDGANVIRSALHYSPFDADLLRLYRKLKE